MSARNMGTRLLRFTGPCGASRAAALVLAMHAGLLAYSAARHSPTIHEMAHLPAGICHWRFGMFELYRVNPPLPRMVAALPVLLCDPKTDWGNYQLHPLSRETIPMGVRFAKANGARTLFLFMVARWACIPFGLLGAWTCYRWAGELWGRRAGLAALCLWCFDPLLLGHGAVVMPDVPAAATGVFAAWRFWKWLRGTGHLPLSPGEGRGEGTSRTSWSGAVMAGLALGVAELCKTTLLVFFALWPLAWLLYRTRRDAIGHSHRSHHAPRDVPDACGVSITRSVMATMAEPLQLLSVLALAVYLINLGYAFRGSCQRLGGYRFQSRMLSGEPLTDMPKVGNRFAGTLLGKLRVPLPRDYVQGIDRQRADFEEGLRSYLHGRWSPRGWWYYYLVGLGIKLPLGTLALLVLAIVASIGNALRCTGVGNALRRISVGNALRRISVGNGLRAVPRAANHDAQRAVANHVAQPPSAASVANTAFLPLPSGEGRGEGMRQAGKPDLRWRDEVFILSFGIAILALVSSQTGFSAHVRYAIPALPYFFIWCGKLFAERVASHTNPMRQRGGPIACVPRWRFGLVRACLVNALCRERPPWRSAVRPLAWLCLLGAIVESLCVYPHSISFFNRLIGGPAHGHEWLLDSNGAWGQDLIYLKEWVERHPEARPLHLAAVGWLDPKVLGIDYTLPPVGPAYSSHHAPRDGNPASPAAVEPRVPRIPLSYRERAGVRAASAAFDRRSPRARRDASPKSEDGHPKVPQNWQEVTSLAELGPRPGWYAIDVNFLHGADLPAIRPGWYFQKIAEHDLNYEYFRFFEPFDRIAYSYLIYHITPEQAAAARRRLGLPR